jgi:hypothetical protein
MKKTILMDLKEPTDKELSQLMSEVAHEAKTKATLVKKQFSEAIAIEISKVRVRMHAMKA